MTKNILVCGNDQLVEVILQHNIIQDQELNIVWYQSEAEFSESVQAILTAASLTKNLTLTATNTPEWKTVDLLLIGKQGAKQSEREEDAEEQQIHSEIHWTQMLINQAMANNFAGKVCFLTEFSELQVFAALHFSGLPDSAIFGLGTLPLALLAERLLANILKIDSRQIHVSVFGTRTTPVPAWSRSLVAGTPLLSLIAQENTIFTQDKLAEIEEVLHKNDPKSLLPVTLLAIDRIFAALFSPFAQIIPLTHQVLLGENKIAISEPVLLSNQGVSKLPGGNLSESEKQEISQIKLEVLTRIEKLIGGS